jgi:hypothetical protein
LSSTLTDFVELLLRDGCAVLKSPPAPTPRADAEVTALLERAHRTYALNLAGPPVRFDGPTALAAASLVHRSCWLLVDRSQPADAVEQILQMPHPPETAAQHVSADLTFRFLPQVHRRAAAAGAVEPLTLHLAKVLRQWPLSGVLSDVTEGPLTAPEFSSHPGLLWLYAERWAQREKPAWRPAGHGLEYLEAVWSDLGRDIQLLREAVAAREGGE